MQGRMTGAAGCTLAKQRSLQSSQEPGHPIVGGRILNVDGSKVGQVIFKIPQALRRQQQGDHRQGWRLRLASNRGEGIIKDGSTKMAQCSDCWHSSSKKYSSAGSSCSFVTSRWLKGEGGKGDA